MTQYKVILSDVDDTLLVSDLTALPTSRVKGAILKAKNKGIRFSIVTARPLKFLEHIFVDLELTDPVILDNGARIYDPVKKEPLWESVIPTETARVILNIAKAYSVKVGVSSKMDSIPDLQEVTEDLRIRKFNIKNLSESNAKELAAKLEQECKDTYVVLAPGNDDKSLFNVMVSNADATKQHAVLKLAEMLGINTEEIIGIGDHYNDFPFLMACGLKVAMGNAVEDLKAIADYVAPTVQEDGVAEVIEKFVLSE